MNFTKLLQMNPKIQSQNLLGITRSKAKMFEYKVPDQFHINITKSPNQLMSLCIGILGDYGKSEDVFESEELINKNLKNLLFSAQFFDSFVESKLHLSFSNYYLLVGASAYYLADFPGNASVLANRILSHSQNLEGDGLESLLIWLLQNDTQKNVDFGDSQFLVFLENIYINIILFYSDGLNEEGIKNDLIYLCDYVYSVGTDRQLLFADIIRAVIRKQIYNSSWKSLSRYSALDINQWRETILKPTFIKEFWPAQKILGEKGVFSGKSAVIQMPTSAGKTKSLEIIIRSSFLSGQSDMAVIIAPFRALCSEIKNSLQLAFKDELVDINEPSDAIQSDFGLEDFNFELSKLVIILTPEKFMYILRTNPEIVDNIGLLIYDEGHQFDNGIRGVTYELLLSSLKNKVSENTQIILISAVISNAESIGNWLIDGEKEIISSSNLFPTYRTIAFASWTTPQGMLQFVKSDSPDELEYYVPRILQQTLLTLKGRERNEKLFPVKENGKEVALFLALKIIPNGSVAIFCGSKKTVKTIYEKVIDLHDRGYDVSNPINFSDEIEVGKLTFLHAEHFGINNKITKSASLGVFAHSGNTPEGLRLAIEYSLQSEKIKFIICTSTLAQGVNLPIRYLLITSFYQARQKIKIRDFHNLIGRAGRSGMHTEGSIIFTDTDLYDKKNNGRENWKWIQAKKLLDSNNSEPCGSTLLTIFDPFISDNGSEYISFLHLDLVNRYINNPESFLQILLDFVNLNDRFSIEGLTTQLNYKIEIISSIESYLMAYWDDYQIGSDDAAIDSLATETLAYYIADQTQKQQILELFRALVKNVKEKITTPERRNHFGRSLLGIHNILEIENWTLTNKNTLYDSNSYDELFLKIWPILYAKSTGNLKKISPADSAFNLSLNWINGIKYHEMLNNLNSTNSKYKAGTQLRSLNQENILDICHNTFSFGTTLIIAAICEVLKLEDDNDNEELITDLNMLQKMIKYGLPNPLAIAFYEIGFSDRVIAIDLSINFDNFSPIRSELIEQIKSKKEILLLSLLKYPSYFQNLLGIIIEN